MNKIINNIWLGDAADVLDDKELKVNNISAIVNVANEQHVVVRDNTIKFFKFGFIDGGYNSKILVKMAVELIKELASLRKNILVVCACGINRSPAIIAEYLSKYDYCYYDEAIEKVKKCRMCVNSNFRLYDRKREVFTLGEVKK